jgi:hypothetical protein
VDIDTVLRKEVNMECQTPDGKIVERGKNEIFIKLLINKIYNMVR